MKMKYEKPLVAVDRYELTQSIAGCDHIKVNAAGYMCFLVDTDIPIEIKSFAIGGVWFADNSCTNQVVQGVQGIQAENAGHNPILYDGICYHTQVNSALTS